MILCCVARLWQPHVSSTNMTPAWVDTLLLTFKDLILRDTLAPYSIHLFTPGPQYILATFEKLLFY